MHSMYTSVLYSTKMLPASLEYVLYILIVKLNTTQGVKFEGKS